jgi:rubredoxin
MEKFTCTICGHVYNPERGEPLQNIPSGKDFITLPENWLCPVCNASKKDFTKE